MIARLTGSVVHLAKEYCVIDTSSGVGYRVFMPGSDLADLHLGNSIKVWVHTLVREDAIMLFGFLEEGCYDLFEILLTVKGVGPKIALGILGSARPENFIVAVQNRDLNYLMQLPGIGKKGAERMLLELKDKFGKAVAGGGVQTSAEVVTDKANVAEAIEALVSLGYSRAEVMPVLQKLNHIGESGSDEIIRQALKLFARR